MISGVEADAELDEQARTVRANGSLGSVAEGVHIKGVAKLNNTGAVLVPTFQARVESLTFRYILFESQVKRDISWNCGRCSVLIGSP